MSDLCEQCNVNTGQLRYDPYQYEIYDIEIKRVLCSGCYLDLIQDI